MELENNRLKEELEEERNKSSSTSSDSLSDSEFNTSSEALRGRGRGRGQSLKERREALPSGDLAVTVREGEHGLEAVTPPEKQAGVNVEVQTSMEGSHIDSTLAALESLKREKQRLQGLKAELEDTVAEREASLKEATEENNRLTAAEQQLTRRMEEHREDMEQLEAEMQELTKTAADERQQRRALEQEMSALQHELRVATTEHQETQHNLASERKRAATAEKRLGDLQDEYDAQQRQLATSRRDQALLTTKAESAATTATRWESKAAEAERTAEELRFELRKAERELERKGLALTDWEEKEQTWQARERGLSSELELLNSKYAEALQRVEAADTTRYEIEEELKAAQSKTTQLTSAIERLEDALALTKREGKGYAETVLQLQEKVAMAVEEQLVLRGTVQLLQRDIATGIAAVEQCRHRMARQQEECEEAMRNADERAAAAECANQHATSLVNSLKEVRNDLQQVSSISVLFIHSPLCVHMGQLGFTAAMVLLPAQAQSTAILLCPRGSGSCVCWPRSLRRCSTRCAGKPCCCDPRRCLHRSPCVATLQRGFVNHRHRLIAREQRKLNQQAAAVQQQEDYVEQRHAELVSSAKGPRSSHASHEWCLHSLLQDGKMQRIKAARQALEDNQRAVEEEKEELATWRYNITQQDRKVLPLPPPWPRSSHDDYSRCSSKTACMRWPFVSRKLKTNDKK